jgi:hypothetical protein
MVLRRLNRNSEPQASIESGAYTLQYVSISIYFDHGQLVRGDKSKLELPLTEQYKFFLALLRVDRVISKAWVERLLVSEASYVACRGI